MPTMEPATVISLYEDALMRDAIGRRLQAVPDLHLVAEPEDVPALKRTLAVMPEPALLILDPELAVANDCALLHWLRKVKSTMRIAVVGPRPALCTLCTLFRAGVTGFCCTRTELGRLPQVLLAVAAGAMHLPEELVAHVRAAVPLPVEAPKHPLTPLHRAILQLTARPDKPTRKCIAGELKISVSRVNTVCTKLCKRFGVKGKGGLVQLAQRFGLGEG